MNLLFLRNKMLKLKPNSASLLALAGFLLMAMGVYFIFLRPSLLPEDLRYMNITFPTLEDKIPNLQPWLQKVFWVLGGYIFTTGLLIIFISQSAFKKRVNGVFVIVTIAGISSIGLMTVVNFLIHSDFKWVLLLFTMPWAISLILYHLKK